MSSPNRWPFPRRSLAPRSLSQDAIRKRKETFQRKADGNSRLIVCLGMEPSAIFAKRRAPETRTIGDPSRAVKQVARSSWRGRSATVGPGEFHPIHSNLPVKRSGSSRFEACRRPSGRSDGRDWPRRQRLRSGPYASKRKRPAIGSWDYQSFNTLTRLWCWSVQRGAS